MRRAALALAVLAVGCAKERGVVVGTGDDALSVIAGELLHGELAANPEGARRKRCGATIDCLAGLRSGAIDVLVLERDELEWLVPGDAGVELIAELHVEQRFSMVGPPSQTRAGLAALGRSARVAVSPRFAARATGGLADLAGVAGVEIEPLVAAEPEQRAAWLVAGVVDAAVVETWRRPPETSELAAIAGSPFVVVASAAAVAHKRDSIARAAGAAVVRLDKLGERILAAVGAGLDPLEAVERLAPRGRAPDPPLALAHGPRLGGWAGVVSRALASRTVVASESAGARQAVNANSAALVLVEPGAPVAGAERVAVFSGNGWPGAELWARTGVLELADARRVLAASARARLPAGDGPSLWRRVTAEARRPAPRGSSRWFDTLVNLLVGTFLIWLLIKIVRRD